MSNKYRQLANQIDSILHMSVSMDAQNQMLEIVFKDSAVGGPSDIPVDTVTTEYHDELIEAAQKETLGIKNALLGERKARATWQSKYMSAKGLMETQADTIVRLRQEQVELLADLDEATKPKMTTITAASDFRGDGSTDPKSKEILPIRQNAMVKGLVQTKEEAAEADAAFDKVRMTKFYTDKELKTIDKMPKFSGYSLKKGKWIYIKQPPMNQLALDETPFLNLRPKRGAKCNLNKNEVWQLRRYIESGRRNNWIEDRMGLSSAAVSQAKSGKTYNKVPPENRKPTTVHAGEGVIKQKKG